MREREREREREGGISEEVEPKRQKEIISLGEKKY